MKNTLPALISARVKKHLKKGQWENAVAEAVFDLPVAERIKLFEGEARFCTVCGSRCARFLPYGDTLRNDVRCPICGSIERHRLLWMFLAERTSFLDGKPKRLLYLGKDRFFDERFRTAPNVRYLAMMEGDKRSDVIADMCTTGLQSASFDLVISFHVLDRVKDDRSALKEIERVLAAGGTGVVTVALADGVSCEIPQSTAPTTESAVQSRRLRRYGRGDIIGNSPRQASPPASARPMT